MSKARVITMKDLDRKYKPEELVGIIEGGCPSEFTGAPHKDEGKELKSAQEGQDEELDRIGKN